VSPRQALAIEGVMGNGTCRLYASVKSIVLLKFGQQGPPHAKPLRLKISLCIVPLWDYYVGMRVIAKKRLVEFWVTYPETQEPLKAWHDEALQANWKSPQDIKDRYPSASFVSNNRVVFNIKGNAYRMIVSVAYKFGAIYIKFIGTHKAYEKIDASTVELD
jgi:mRNA interferase HigB